MCDLTEVNLTIGGVKLVFPFKPYPSQLSLMSMVIKGLQNGKHCLLESPTGSGKTLALLCSALAWQKEYRSSLQKALGDDEMLNDSADGISLQESQEGHERSTTAEFDDEEIEKLIPKIWFGTRTHKQIAQITHELGQSAYKDAKMTILSSREHSCIHPINKNASNKADACMDLRMGKHSDMPGANCSFYQNVNRMGSHGQLNCQGLTTAWDLEDLVNLGTKLGACPYFSARELIKEAAIIFCPYNYLIDPTIRKQLEINLRNQVVILDEAHNIEDSAREAASYTMNEADLENTVVDLDFLITKQVREKEHRSLHALCTRMGLWIHARLSDLQESGFETWSRVWVGTELIPDLQEWGITTTTLPILKKNFLDATEKKENEDVVLLHSAGQSLLSRLFTVVEFLFKESNKFAEDYRIALVRSAQFGYPPPKRTRDGRVSISNKASKYVGVNLHFWCMNPGVAFGYLSCTRTVVLTSGTLSPMSSFSSELGLQFPIQLEAPHVIPDSQVWVGCVGSGPNGHALQATYTHTNSFEFQDELGKLISVVCAIVPKGVLCFLSSYKILEILSERWKNTGVWNEIQKTKRIFAESSGRNKKDFDEVLRMFYTSISSNENGDCTGALLLAVCRGKVSEGLDFADDNARAVITVGIPYPNFKDKQVELKRKYNNSNGESKGLLSGTQWYEIQAYRALNQALGRCIRHRNDWGALIIVDSRFCHNPKRYCKGLSKWVRQKLNCHSNFSMFTNSLVAFCHAQACQKLGNSFVSDKQCCHSGLKNETSPVTDNRSVARLPMLPVKSPGNGQTVSRKDTLFAGKSKRALVQTNIFGTQDIADEICSSRSTSQLQSNSATCVIQSTPTKDKEVYVVPESPRADDDDNDFQSTDNSLSSKLLSLSRKSRTKPLLSDAITKKCRISINFDDSEPSSAMPLLETTLSFEESASDGNDVPKLKTRKKQRVKMSSSQTKTDKKDPPGKICINCRACSCKLLTRDEVMNKVSNKFKYVQVSSFNSDELYVTGFDLRGSRMQQINSTSGNLNLNAAWCSADNIVYSFYECADCKQLVAFTILLSKCHENKLFFLPSAVQQS